MRLRPHSRFFGASVGGAQVHLGIGTVPDRPRGNGRPPPRDGTCLQTHTRSAKGNVTLVQPSAAKLATRSDFRNGFVSRGKSGARPLESA